MKNREFMSSGNPFKVVLTFSIPSILAMLVNAIYNIVDKIFIGNYVSQVALGGLQVVNPLTFISFGIMVMFGLGSASYASNKLGEHKDDEANKIFNNSLVIGTISVLVVTLIYAVFKNKLLNLAGATVDNYSYANEYYTCLIFGFVFQFISYFFTMNIRSEGKPVISMIAQITGCFVNIVLDALFIIVFKWGVFGAAFATVIGHFSNFIVGLGYYIFGKNKLLKINLKEGIKVNFYYIYQVASIGLSSAVLNLCTGTATIIYNNVLSKYQDALSILAILTSLDQICALPCVGIRQGLLPIMGYNYGEKNYQRIFKVYWVGLLYGIGYGLFACSMIMLFPGVFINMFVDSSDPKNLELISKAIEICKYYQIGIIFISCNMNTSALYQASRQKVKSIILSAMRQFLFLVPAVYIIDSMFGYEYIFASTPISDLLSAISAFIIFLTTLFFFKKHGFLNTRDMRAYESSEHNS